MFHVYATGQLGLLSLTKKCKLSQVYWLTDWLFDLLTIHSESRLTDFGTHKPLHSTFCMNSCWCKQWICKLFVPCVAQNLQLISITHRYTAILLINNSWKMSEQKFDISGKTWQLHKTFAKTNKSTNERHTHKGLDLYTINIEQECTLFNWYVFNHRFCTFFQIFVWL